MSIRAFGATGFASHRRGAPPPRSAVATPRRRALRCLRLGPTARSDWRYTASRGISVQGSLLKLPSVSCREHDLCVAQQSSKCKEVKEHGFHLARLPCNKLRGMRSQCTFTDSQPCRSSEGHECIDAARLDP